MREVFLTPTRSTGIGNVEMFGQRFFVMRARDVGMCLWGPEDSEEISGFLRVAQHFGAHEKPSLMQRIARWLHVDRKGRDI